MRERCEIPLRLLLEGRGGRGAAGGFKCVELGEDVAEGPARAGVERPGASQLQARERPVRTGAGEARSVSTNTGQMEAAGVRKRAMRGLHSGRRRRGSARPLRARALPGRNLTRCRATEVLGGRRSWRPGAVDSAKAFEKKGTDW